MALLLPVLLLLALVTIDLGRGVYYYSATYNAAREGIIDPSDEVGIKDAAINLAIGLDLDQNDVTVVPDPPDPNIKTIQVTVVYNFKPITFEIISPLGLQWANGGVIQMHSTSIMLIER